MMKLKKEVFTILLILLCVNRLSAQSYGLSFASHEVTQETRTSLALNPDEDFCFRDKCELSFEFSFHSNRNTYFGYLFRLINNSKQNVDLVFNQRTGAFNIISGEAFANIDFLINDSILFNTWIKIAIRIDGNELSLWQNGKLTGKTKIELRDKCFRLFFGACNLYDFKTTDVPPLMLKDIRLKLDQQPNHYWPLNEAAGNVAKDSTTGRKAVVSNPLWILPTYEKWQLVQSLTVKGNASMAFDAAKEIVYMVSEDSLYTYNARDGHSGRRPFSNNKHHLLLGNNSIFNPIDERLYNYFVDSGWVTAYDTVAGSWSQPFKRAEVTEYWQANRFISVSQNALYVMGGYGQLKYKNDIQKYDFSTNKWTRVKVKGDSLTPHYLASLAADRNGDLVYLLGGYGSTKGDQVLNPRYLYDLMRFDVKKQEMKKLFSLKEPKEQFLFANSFVLDTANNSYYALIFPNDRFQSHLQLIKGSITSPDYVLAADSIPYTFKDVRSFADLHLCKQSKRLLAFTVFTDKEKNISSIKIYSIAFPPNLLATKPAGGNSESSLPFIILTGGIVLVALLALWGWQRKKNRRIAQLVTASQLAFPAVQPEVQAPSQVTATSSTDVEAVPRASILLFGNFEVIDNKGNHLTRYFTPLIKEMFLLITLYTIKSGHGISSEKLNEILWNDKSNKDAKNNRSVNMVKLKNLLDQLGGCTVMKEADKWILKYDADQVQIDLAQLLSLTTQKQPYTRSEIRTLLHIVQRGAFLLQTDYPWLDDMKSAISNLVIDALVRASETGDGNTPDILIEIANCIFGFDQINEHALKIKCKSLIALGRHSLARNFYDKFVRDYHQMYGDEFPQSFNEVVT